MLALLALILAACGSPDDSTTGSAATATPTPEPTHSAEIGETLPSVEGYDYADAPADPTTAAVRETFEENKVRLAPPVVFVEDFSYGSGPFGTWSDDDATVEVRRETLRVTHSDPENGWSAYAGLPVRSTAVLVSATVKIPRDSAGHVAPFVSVDNEAGDTYVLFYDQEQLVLGETRDGRDRQVGAATIRNGPSTVRLTLLVLSHDDDPTVVGLLDDEPLVGGVIGKSVFDAVTLGAWSDGTRVTAIFDDVVVGALPKKGELPTLFPAGWEHTVLGAEGPIGTLLVAEVAPHLRRQIELLGEAYLPAQLPAITPRGMTAKEITIGDRTLVRGALQDKSFWVWIEDDLLYVLSAETGKEGKAYVTALLGDSSDSGATGQMPA